MSADLGKADHGNQDNPLTGADRYSVPFFVWGPGVTAGADLYSLNAGLRQTLLNPAGVKPAGDEDRDEDAYWRLLREGVNAVGEVPRDRWDADAYYDPRPDTPGKSYGRWGAFLDQVDRFDPQFFGIAPREAVGIDPAPRPGVIKTAVTVGAGLMPAADIARRGCSRGVPAMTGCAGSIVI